MPWGDRTGPFGQGPGTGRRMGYCGGFGSQGFTSSPRFGIGRGGRCRGRIAEWAGRLRRRCFRRMPFLGGMIEESEILKKEAEILKKRLSEIESQISEIEKKKAE